MGSQEGRSGINVLFVDDEPALLNVMKLYLEESGDFKVDTEESALRALERLRTESFDIIVSDYMMPEMNGIEFLKAIRSSGNTIPLIIFTGQGREEAVIQAFENGADYYIRKGSDAKLLNILKSEVVGVIESIRDIPDIKNAEDELIIKNEKLRAAYEELASTKEELLDNFKELEKSHRKLKKSEERLHRLFDAMNEGVALHRLIYDKEGNPLDYRIIAVNPSFERIIGIESHRIKGKLSTEAYGVKEPPYLDIYAGVVESGISRIFETYFPGLKKHFRISVYSPEKRQFVTVFEDITERKGIEKAIRESEIRFRSVFEESPLGMEIFDSEGKLTRINQKCVEIFGLVDESEVIGFDLFEDPNVSDVMKGLLREGRSVHYEAPFDFGKVKEMNLYRTTRSGTIFIEVVITPLKSDGVISGYSVQVNDITDKKVAEEALKESENQYRNIFESFEDTYYQTDANGLITLLSPSVYHLSGWKPEELIGKPATTLYVNPEERIFLLEKISTNGYLMDYELLLRKKDGTPLPISLSASVMRDSYGNAVGIKGSIRDITDRKQAEKAVMEANKKLNMLNSVTRHDINNQIMVLYMQLHMIEKQTTGKEMTELIKIAEDAANRIQELIAFTKEYQDIGVEAPCWENASHIIALAMSHFAIYPYDVVIDLDSVEIYADPLIGKVFYNLLDNVVRHGKNATRVVFTGKESGDDYILICEDDGGGIDPEMRKDLFKRGHGRNTGYGLYLIREILSITGITIEETGEPGKGARFEMMVPKGGYRFAGDG